MLTSRLTSVTLVLILLVLVALFVWSVAVARPSDIPWSELIPAIVGGTIGALAGGIPAYFIAARGSKEVLARDKAARVERERAEAFRAHVAVAQMVNGILTLHAQMESMLRSGQGNEKAEVHPWLVVLPIAGLSLDDVARVDASSAAVFAAAGAADYVNELLLLPRRHAAIIDALQVYAQKREKLFSSLTHTSFGPDTADSLLTEEETRGLMPLMMELNSLIRQVMGHLLEDRETALHLAKEFGPIMRRHFDDPAFPGFNLDRVPS